MKDLYKCVWFAENQFILSTYKPFMSELYNVDTFLKLAYKDNVFVKDITFIRKIVND